MTRFKIPILGQNVSSIESDSLSPFIKQVFETSSRIAIAVKEVLVDQSLLRADVGMSSCVSDSLSSCLAEVIRVHPRDEISVLVKFNTM